MLRYFSSPRKPRSRAIAALGLFLALFTLLNTILPGSVGLTVRARSVSKGGHQPCLRCGLGHIPRPAVHATVESDEGIVAVPVQSITQRDQHLARLGVIRWHADGFRGRGVKVAILDSGFRGYREFLGKTLPSKVQTRSFRADGNLEARNSQHGILCGEVVYSLAPEAELLFANWEPEQSETFLNAVRWARDQGAQIVSCSVITPSWSDGEGGGPVHAELARILGGRRMEDGEWRMEDGGWRQSREFYSLFSILDPRSSLVATADRGNECLMFASAGNTAQRHWSGRFRDAGDGFHEWQPGQKDNELSPWGEDRVSVELSSLSDASYDLFVYDRTAGKEAGHCTQKDRHKHFADASGSVVRFQPVAQHSYQVRVRLAEGTAPHPDPSPPTAGERGRGEGKFHLVALGSGLSCSTPSGSIVFPADGPEVVAVGAVDGVGRRAPYSSCGPNSSTPKPDLVAPVPFPILTRNRPFSGTSAAAPQAAALAALLWSHHPDWTAEKVRETMYTSASDVGPPRHDFETGYGQVKLP